MTARRPLCYRDAVMTLDALHARHRLYVAVLLTLLPWPAVWLGMYRLDNIVWTFFLYHGCCLLPAAVWGRRLWLDAVRWPTRGQWLCLLAAFLVVVPLSLFLYGLLGAIFMNTSSLLSIVTERGFRIAWLLPFGFYFVAINATLEELFWRGVVLNELRGTGEAIWTVGAVWTAFTFAAWHYLVLHLLLRPGWAEAAVLGILATGIFLSWLYRQTQSIVVPILWHALIFDFALFVVFRAVLKAA